MTIMTVTTATSAKFNQVRHWLPLVFVLIAIGVLAPQVKPLHTSLHLLHRLNYQFIALSCVEVAATFFFAAYAYVLLAIKPIKFGPTLVVQIAANFINRILPAGIGGLGINYRYLRRSQHTAAQAASIVSANNGLGFIGHVILLLTLMTLFHGKVMPVKIQPVQIITSTGLILAFVIFAVVVPRFRLGLGRRLTAFWHQLISFRKRPNAIFLALSAQLCLTLSNVTAFWLCGLALHFSLSFIAALLIFTLGFGIGNLTPTPGGLGGVEAGLALGLIAFGATSAAALATVIAYRLISYWLPLFISAPVFLYANRQKYF